MRWILWLTMLCWGCDDGATDDDPGAGGGAAPPAGDTFVAGLSKTGTNGQVEVFLDEATPAPPERGDNTWLITIQDADGTPMTGCNVVPTPRMPAHGHGTNTDARVTDVGGGSYELTPLDLFMPGLWEVPIAITCGEVTDTVQYDFWIEG